MLKIRFGTIDIVGLIHTALKLVIFQADPQLPGESRNEASGSICVNC